MKIFLLAVLSYIIGSFPTGVVIGKKFYNIDIREHGSKNMGGTNAGRVLGKKAGIIVTVIDIAKLMIPTYLARRYYGIDIAAIIGACGMVGHAYPVFAKFKGGKCVSSYMGVMLVLNPLSALIPFAIWNILKYVLNYVSLSSMIACVLSAFLFKFFSPENQIAFYVMLAAAFFVIFLHRANIKRLLNGTENKTRKKQAWLFKIYNI